MASAKEIHVAPIASADANALVRRVHYSGKVVPNSQLHFGVFLDGKLEGAMQFGPSMDKRKIQGLVRGTPWNGFLELNRMAFSDRLPRNSESRGLAVAFRLIRKHYPHLQWIVSFADGTQCGDGTIYRASGFQLCGITKNGCLWRMKDGTFKSTMTLWHEKGLRVSEKRRNSLPVFSDVDGLVEGFQLRYIYFLDATAKARLTVPILPFSRIDDVGARMYLGEKRAGSSAVAAPADQAGEGGSIPTPALQPSIHLQNETLIVDNLPQNPLD